MNGHGTFLVGRFDSCENFNPNRSLFEENSQAYWSRSMEALILMTLFRCVLWVSTDGRRELFNLDCRKAAGCLTCKLP
jgi:hypothetical protein